MIANEICNIFNKRCQTQYVYDFSHRQVASPTLFRIRRHYYYYYIYAAFFKDFDEDYQ